MPGDDSVQPQSNPEDRFFSDFSEVLSSFQNSVNEYLKTNGNLLSGSPSTKDQEASPSGTASAEKSTPPAPVKSEAAAKQEHQPKNVEPFTLNMDSVATVQRWFEDTAKSNLSAESQKDLSDTFKLIKNAHGENPNPQAVAKDLKEGLGIVKSGDHSLSLDVIPARGENGSTNHQFYVSIKGPDGKLNAEPGRTTSVLVGTIRTAPEPKTAAKP